MEKDSLEAIKADTTLDTYTIQETAADLLNSLITEGTKSILSLRKHIKGFKLPTNQEYDPVKHADLTFIENVVIHFIDLALSPRNPLLFKSLERTAAIHTSIFLLNSLFLSYNDKLSFSWIEVETLLTNKTKWDGVGFCPTADKKIGMVLVEMAGGILWNKGKKKAECDYKKLEEGVISFIEYTGSNIGHLVRYHGKFLFSLLILENIQLIPLIIDVKLYFEIIKLVDNSYIRTNCSTIVFPTTPTTFIDFFEEIPKILQWRKSLLNSVNYIS
ncbi:hypothetical protein BD770DRAFT_317702 [Pilaira anomala]|nr:hypothetical protein BD770DRAFT_317702 [Pilaira anomala]